MARGAFMSHAPLQQPAFRRVTANPSIQNRRRRASQPAKSRFTAGLSRVRV